MPWWPTEEEKRGEAQAQRVPANMRGIEYDITEARERFVLRGVLMQHHRRTVAFRKAHDSIVA